MEYFNAWASMRYLVIEQGLSWSGREKDHLFLNLGDGSFAELSALSAADNPGDARGISVVDWDDDGRLDVFLKSRTEPRVCFYRNQLGKSGHYLVLDLQGVRCNRDAIGARVEVHAGERTYWKTLRAGEGYLAQSSKRMHFGLGAAPRAERVVVHWPDGTSDAFADLAADARYRLVQGEAQARPVAARPATLVAAGDPPSTAPAQRAVPRVPLVEKLPLGPLELPAVEGPARKVSDLAGGPVLLNLWSTTCTPCMTEFGEWKEHRAEIEAAGLRIVTMGTDAADKPAEAREILGRFGLARDAGVADARFLAALEVLIAEVVEERKVLPLPTSLLLDARGQLVVLYLGRPSVATILADVQHLASMDPDKRSALRLLGGIRMLSRGRDFPGLAERFRLLGRPELADYYAAQKGD